MYLENRKVKHKEKLDPVVVFFIFAFGFLVASLLLMNVATTNAFKQPWYEDVTMEQIFELWETQRFWMTTSVISFIMAIISLILAKIKESKL
jgi:hypothetical protein